MKTCLFQLLKIGYYITYVSIHVGVWFTPLAFKIHQDKILEYDWVSKGTESTMSWISIKSIKFSDFN